MKHFLGTAVFLTFLLTVKADYKAAVVEYTPLSESTANATVERNLEEYIHYIEAARSNGVQIIVFPEYGLTGLVEDPSSYAIEVPATGGNVFQNYWLQKLSNAAVEHGLYIVVNLLEKARNENNDTIYYNTNLVFSTSGQIVSKYRKINLYFEHKITPGKETVTFTTDFGVTFGIFTCSDILYYNPSRSIFTENNTVYDVIFPSAWTSILPYYHSLSIQSGYAQANRVNLLASNLNSPSQGLGGSGIYRYDGTVDAYYISGISASKLLISTLQPVGTTRDEGNIFTPYGFDILNASQAELKNFITVRDFQTSRYQMQQLELSTTERQDTLCYGTFCCNFTTAASDIISSEIYQLVVYNGPTKLAENNGNIKICAVVSCESSDPSTCGSRNVSLLSKFSKISIISTFDREYYNFYQPVTLTTNLLPIFNTSYVSIATNQKTQITFNSTRTVENLVVFGVFGRGRAPAFGCSVLFLVVMSALKFMF